MKIASWVTFIICLIVSLFGIVFHLFEPFITDSYIPLQFTSILFLITYICIFISLKKIDDFFKEKDKSFYRRKSIWIFLIVIILNPIVYCFFHMLNIFLFILEILIFLPPLFLASLNFKSKNQKKSKSLFIVAIITALLQILLIIFQWEILGRFIISLFILPIFSLVIHSINLILLIIITISIIKNKSYNWKIFTALFLLLFSFTLHFLPINEWDIDFFFYRNKTKMVKSLALIKSEKIKPHNEYGLAYLPDELKSCSRRSPGEIHISSNSYSLKVMFYTFCGILDNFSGIVYSEDDTEPTNEEFGADFKQVIKLEKHWYFCASM